MKQLPKAYEASQEKETYKKWESTGLFNPDNMEKYLKENGYDVKKPFTITLPPPNANGNLHLGHMCGYSFHDAIGRYMRMTGHPTLLLPGKDHAGIQTETAFSKKLQSEGTSKWELGREEFYKQCYEFTMKNAKNARAQEKNIGLSADYSRELFTLDPKLTEIIYETFYKMYEDGLVYRDKRIINQCPECRTALADIDTEHEERRGIFAYIKYPLVDTDEYITVATTRPETMLGDTAIAVNPEDSRYKEYIGKKVLLPIANREIPVIADEDVDMEKGTGAVKVTPAHSPVDFDLGQKHDLEIVNVIDEEGKMTGEIPERFKGMDTIACSKKLCAELDEQGLLEKIENIKHEVAVCERCRTPIEPIISDQWYIDVSDLAEKALKELKKGNVKVLPEGQQRALEHFFENIEPWCISRQLWWGQRIPIWYKGSKKKYDEEGTEIHLGENPPDDSGDWEPETDMFDTWFSSGQWPYSTLGGPDSKEYEKYYPTQLMIHARDILFWWSARMIMMGLYRTDKVPFPQVFLTGMILAEDGTKMSKSKGNGVEPKEVFDKYGADALRLWYYSDALPGSNAPLREEKIRGNRNFVNKIWNASRFIIMNIEEEEVEDIVKYQPDDTLKRVKATREHIKSVSEYIEKYQFNLGAESIREFFWHTLCDVWIEEVKDETQDKEIGSDVRIQKLGELLFLLKENLKIMHPFIPFVTEAVWQELVKLDLAEGVLMEQQINI
jgi:valyl-tRNA synthetase